MQKIRDGLFLIDLDQALEGYRRFISTWVCRIEGATLIIDPGPTSTIPHLVNQLKQCGIGQVDHVLLTHIHLDHAGGTGHLLRHFPEARVNCHPKGIPHLLSPQKLWEGSKKVLGDVADTYGEMAPVPESNVSWSEEIPLDVTTIEVFETPGHAAHHVSYRVGDILFVGEVVGVYVPIENGSYSRPATPPTFQYETFRDSITKVASLDVSVVCLGHYGCRRDVASVFQRAERQLDFWVDMVNRHLREGIDSFEETILADLITNDPDMAGWPSLPKDIQARERNFCCNSIRGIQGYLARAEGEKARS